MIPKQEVTSYAPPESAKQMAVQKTLDLIKSFKKEETQEAMQQQSYQLSAPTFNPEPIKQ